MTLRNTHMAVRAMLAALWIGAVLAILSLLVVGQSTASGSGPELTPTPAPGVFYSYRVVSPPQIDGNLGEWPGDGALLLNRDTAFSLSGTFDSIADAAATCWSQWDAAAIYVACAVQDDQLIADSAHIWEDDTVELAFDGHNDNVRFCGSGFCPDDHLYEVRVDGAVRDNDGAVAAGVVGAVGRQPDGYGLEMRIPVAQFDTGALAAGMSLGFNLGLIDDDDGGGTDGHLFWRGYSTYSQPENFGDLVLLDPFVTPTATRTATATRTPTRTATPSPSPTPVQTIDISAALPIDCGEVAVGNTAGAADNVNWYACAPGWPENGPENVYRFTAPGGVTVDALLGGLSEDLDLFVLTGVSPSTCIAAGDTSVSLPDLAAGDYYLVIDGFDGASGPYRLNVWCPLDPSPQASPTPTATVTPQPRLLRLYLPLVSARP